MIIDEQVYLEHFGVKGMRWGTKKAVRRASKANNLASALPKKKNVKKATEAQRKSDWKNRPRASGGQKAIIAATAAGAAFVTARLVANRTMNPMLTVVAGGTAAVAGKRLAQNQLAKRGKMRMSDLSEG